MNAPVRLNAQLAIDQQAQQQLALLGAQSAWHQIQWPGRLFHVCCWVGLTLGGILLPLSLGLGLFLIGILNYFLLLGFRLGNFFFTPINWPTPSVEEPTTALPTFTIIFPLKNENEVIHQTLEAIQALDYPSELVQVIIVVEETDQITHTSLAQIELPSNYEILEIPEMPPFTKGRALLHALARAQGTYLTVYDAESRPEPQQLRKAAGQMLQATGETCLQAKITIANGKANWLTRNFAAEYYEWYEQHLLELSRAHLPFGLGGNSFFIAKKALIAAGAWDPFNVTEDADLSVRLVQNGVKLQILNSYTTETCPEHVNNWINQRTRWNKGLFITQLVHLPKTLFDQHFQLRGWLSFWLRMIGASLLPFFNVYIALYMLLAPLPYPLTRAFSLTLWLLLGINLALSWLLNIITYRRLGIVQGYLSIFGESLRYLLLHIFAGFKSFGEYFLAPLQWNKTQH